MTQTDQALVAASRRGDRAAFEELVRRTARLVFARAYLDTGNVHRAEDLTQETFLVAWKSIQQVTDATGFRPWLLSIAQTVAIDAARREGRKKRRGAKPQAAIQSAQQVADRSMSPAQIAERAEERERALSALRQLPQEYRDVMTLRYLGDVDYETICRQLALSNGSLRGLLHRGMALLRSRLNEKQS